MSGVPHAETAAQPNARASFTLLACLAAASLLPPPTLQAARPLHPLTPTTNVVDTYHGVEVADPYRWLEDASSPTTRAWIADQNQVTSNYLAGCPELPVLRQRLAQLWNYERTTAPIRRGSRFFYTRNDGAQKQAVLCVTEDLTAPPRVLLDPNTLSPDGTIALSSYSVTPDGRRLAYGLSIGGSDWTEWRVRDVDSGKDLEDLVRWAKFSTAAWTADGQGFFYSRFDEPAAEAVLSGANYFHKLYYHQVGTPQSQDRLVYHRPDQKDWTFSPQVTEDGRYLVLTASQGTTPKKRILYQELQTPGAPVTELIMEFDASYLFLDSDGPVLWFRTDLNAPRGRLIAVDVRHPDRPQWKTILPETADTLTGAAVVGGRLLALYLRDAHSLLQIHQPDGTLVRQVELPGRGTLSSLTGRRQDPQAFFTFTSYRQPPVVFALEPASAQPTRVWPARLAFNPDDYETHQVFCPSRDGTRIPMFLSHRKDLRPDPQTPVYLYGYGGFNISQTPNFSPANLLWMELGGIYAVANLRGGGEYGRDWHLAGTRLRKQNVFDDFIAAAEWLVQNRKSRPDRIAIGGGSNGGLLVAAVLNQRPDLFGAALPAVGVMDMLRFHRFTIGWGWTSDYGSPDDPEEFRALYAYSPLHNLRTGTRYPATLITTADHDDRVVPAHSYKYAAALQTAQAGPAPILIRIDTRAGHGAGKPTDKLIEDASVRLAFMIRELGLSVGKAPLLP